MAIHNLFKIIAKVPGELIPSRYRPDPQYLSFMIRYARTKERTWDIIKWCIAYGYVMGHRATVNGSYKESYAAEYDEQFRKIQEFLKERGVDVNELERLS